MASPAQNFTRRLYHGDGAPLPTGSTLAAYGLAVATMFAVVLVIGAGRDEAAIAEVAGLGLVPLAVTRLHRVPWAHLGLIAPRPRALIGAIVAGAGLWLIALEAARPMIELTQRQAAVEELTTHFFGGRPALIGVVLALVVVPAVCEELTHRGLLLGGLAPRVGRVGAIAVSTALFALLHVEPARMVSTAILGLAAALCALWSGSVWPAIALHATNNLVVALLGLGLVPRLAGALDRDPRWCLGGAVALAIGGLATIYSARVIAPGRARVGDSRARGGAV